MANNLRADITGLRAVAVLAVTSFHIDYVLLPQLQFIPGGFLGVDIFFVISGYLMTMIIMRGLDQGNFSVLKFYQHRAKRICPALLITVTVTCLFGMLVLSPDELEMLCREAGKALMFISNFYFAHRDSYFEAGAFDHLLLHTWSLSVEWQFYFVYPFALLLANKFLSRQNIARLVSVCLLASLVFACVYTTIDARSSYYMLSSRAFELLFGALAYFYPLGRSSAAQNALQRLACKLSPAAIEAFGLLLIVVSIFVVTDQNGWPTAASIPPLVGSYLCIAANNQRSWLRFSVFQQLGLWSYAIYLVHWPILAYLAKFFSQDMLSTAFLVIMLACIFALGAIMHFTVERSRAYGYKFLGLYLVLLGGSFGAASADGFPQRVQNQLYYWQFATYVDGPFPRDALAHKLGASTQQPSFLLAGDSFSRHYISDFIDRGFTFIAITQPGCYSAHSYYVSTPDAVPDSYKNCPLLYSDLLREAQQHPDIPIIRAQRWGEEYDEVIKRNPTGKEERVPMTTDVVKQDLYGMAQDFKGHNVYIILLPRNYDQPYGNSQALFNLKLLDNIVSNAIARRIIGNSSANIDSHEVNRTLIATIEDIQKRGLIKDAQGKGSMHYIDPSPAYCHGSQGNECELLVDGVYPRFDPTGHFTWAGSIAPNSLILKEIGLPQGRVRTDFSPRDVPHFDD